MVGVCEHGSSASVTSNATTDKLIRATTPYYEAHESMGWAVREKVAHVPKLGSETNCGLEEES